MRDNDSKTISKKEIRAHASALSDTWVEQLRSPLEHKFGIDGTTIKEMSELMKKLHVLSRPNNLKTSYEVVLRDALKNFKNKFVLPIQQADLPSEAEAKWSLDKYVERLSDAQESELLTEAIACAHNGFLRAAIVLGWCAGVDRIQKKIGSVGYATFNSTSQVVKSQTAGKNKNWNKEFKVTTLSELQAIFDKDLIVVIEAMGLIDGNQADRLRSDFEYRNQSAHPGQAPIEEAHVVAFFADVVSILLANSTFDLV